MKNYFEQAISKIYGDEDDFIIIGLTGQTGSGCSTVASILSKQQEQIKHSLYKGNTPENNTQRKEKIVFKCFEKTWTPFISIQASSILTLMLSEIRIEESSSFIGTFSELPPSTKDKIFEVIKSIKERFEKLDTKDIESLREFYTDFLPNQNTTLKKEIGASGYVKNFHLIVHLKSGFRSA